MVDAGRGQPNWTVTEPRAAFFRLGLFATQEADRHSTTDVWGEMPPAAGIHDRLLASAAEDAGTDLVYTFTRTGDVSGALTVS